MRGLEPAAARRLITARGAGRYAFTHDLVRERLVAALPGTERSALHAAVVRALVEQAGSPAEAATVAHHARLAVPHLPAIDAIGYLLAAARDASARQAAEESVRHYRAALALTGAWAVFSGAGIVWGPMAYWAAVVDAAQGRRQEAVTGFTTAAEVAGRFGVRPWSTPARAHLAEALLARGSSGDTAASAAEIDAARHEADELGMPQALARFAHLSAPDTTATERVFHFDGQV